MASGSASRHLRTPIPQAVFNQKTLVTTTVAPANWVNLRWKQYATKSSLFHISESGRLTPGKRRTPCIYVSPTERTSFLELYGDHIHLARQANRSAIIEASDFSERVFMDVQMPEVVLVDMTSGEGIRRIDIDLGTLYAPDPKYPQAFAQAVVDHPARVDGILYESRHTKEICAVVWMSNRRKFPEVIWGNMRTLGDRVENLNGAVATIFGEAVLVAS